MKRWWNDDFGDWLAIVKGYALELTGATCQPSGSNEGLNVAAYPSPECRVMGLPTPPREWRALEPIATVEYGGTEWYLHSLEECRRWARVALTC